ncbi:MAG TPA: sigma 54-interacting transcriptional regulator [Steroidobacteraceae bacterium]
MTTPTTSLGFGLTGKAKESERPTDDAQASAGRKAKILVVDPDPALRRLMVSRLGGANYAVETADGAHPALDACVRSRPNLVITDLRMKDMEGLAFLKELKSRWPQLTVIVLTAHGTIPEAVQATQYGAFGYLVKPVGKEELLGQVQRATAVSTFTLTEGDWRASIVSRSRLMEDRLGIANRAAGSDVPVLLTGENGTGKELLARAIHAASARRERPFVVVSCRDTTATALESELFGPASDDPRREGPPRDGAFQRALGGTVLVDEIGDLPMSLQVTLAKTLAKDDITARGSADAVRPDARLICTTSRDLKPLLDSGGFLRDLYYQISVLPIEIPPLGRRREDIPLLVSHFLEQATEPGGQKKIYSPNAIELLATTDWPGNVRQLFDLVKQNVALSHGNVMTKEFVEQSLGGDPAKIPSYDEAREKFSRDYLAENLQRTAGNVTQAARLAKRTRTDFYKLLARYRLHPDDFKSPGPRSRKADPDEED